MRLHSARATGEGPPYESLRSAVARGRHKKTQQLLANLEAEYAFVTYGEPDLEMARLISVSAELFEMIRGQAEHASHALNGILCSIFKKGLDMPNALSWGRGTLGQVL